eukprot:TRINITY_DN2977_c0_g1_i1.p1 TRINITY_DN2977_c0_g1~~TRINITY_DN2977_c0_g1_i1.p1  ORF type:complete len:327 (+),score=70.32 TRINITY_DN2977_c0_g1_i1:80-1060(+)
MIEENRTSKWNIAGQFLRRPQLELQLEASEETGRTIRTNGKCRCTLGHRANIILISMHTSVESWNKAAATYSAGAHGEFVSHLIQHGFAILGQNEKLNVLDIATGRGSVPFQISKLYPNVKIVATDYSSEMIKHLEEDVEKRSLGDSIKPQVMDAQAINFPADNFDAIFSAFGMNLVPDLTRAFNEQFRVLKPGGYAIHATWTPHNTFPQTCDAVYRERFPDDKDGLGLIGPLSNEEDYKQRYSNAGFVDVQCLTWTGYSRMPLETVRQTLDSNPATAKLRSKVGDAEWPNCKKQIEDVFVKMGATEDPNIIQFSQTMIIGMAKKP